MSGQYCVKCGKRLPEGKLKYVVDIRVYADFDGVLNIPEGDIEEEVHRLMGEIESMDPDELEKDVYQEMAFLLCKGCRDRFMEDPLSKGEGPYPAGEGSSQFIH
ncbi:MAG: hypothetical protein JSW70_00865 [Syntrophobacterales bacterium]|nr:MAG: hypothetical protein JSW70_00865 [Syntrophobacterales bacterium]